MAKMERITPLVIRAVINLLAFWEAVREVVTAINSTARITKVEVVEIKASRVWGREVVTEEAKVITARRARGRVKGFKLILTDLVRMFLATQRMRMMAVATASSRRLERSKRSANAGLKKIGVKKIVIRLTQKMARSKVLAIDLVELFIGLH